MAVRIANFILGGFLCAFAGASNAFAGNGMLEIKDGYFWDPIKQEYFIPRGIAYQIWNPPVGANQSLDQVNYDLLEFKKIYCNSVRCEIVWGEVEVGDGVYDWRKPDYLVKRAEELGLKLFILVGFQYPPSWFPKAWRGINYQGLTPEVMACLANSTPANALQCLPKSIIDCLSTNLISTNAAPASFTNALNCLVAGAREGSVSNVLSRLERTLPPDDLSKIIGCLISDVINYEHPEARRVYTNHIAAVTGRYKNSKAIGGWILGNEYAYFDLWEDPDLYYVHRFIGYDPLSQASFRQYLSETYGGKIALLNANWGTAYASFNVIITPTRYPDDRNNAAYFDLIQWRKKSIGDFVAIGAAAAKVTDPNHLKTYSMVGGIFNGRDANYTCEDARTIVARCKAAGAPLDFWSLNNYANAEIGSEKRSADFGVGKYQEESGLPIMISETGHSSTEDLFDKPNAGARQAKALPGQIWESLVSGAIGTHLFHWNDRSQFVKGYFLRERGFGIVEQNRKIKTPVYDNTVTMFRRMAEFRIDNLLGGSVDPRPDIQIFWSTNSDMVWPRANQEIAMMWGALKRLGFQPGIIDDKTFEAGGYTNAPALLLCRAFALLPKHLDLVLNNVINAGIHVHADADLPGQFDAYHRPNPNWAARMNAIFGIDVSGASTGLDAIVTNDFYSPLTLKGLSSLGTVLGSGYAASVNTWKIWHGVKVINGSRTIVADSGYLGSSPNAPALVIKTNSAGHGKTAVNTFALGDTYLGDGVPHEPLWDFRYDWLRAIYQTHFGMTPIISLSGPGAKYVIPDYRICRNNSILISLLNEHTNVATITLNTPALLTGKKVENLTAGGIITANSSGTLTLNLAGDDYVLLYAYPADGGVDGSLINPSPQKIWFDSAPTIVWPRASAYELKIGYDTQELEAKLFVSFERAKLPNSRIYGLSANAATVKEKGVSALQVTVSDADLNDLDYIASSAGGEYVFHAWLEQGGRKVTETFIPVRLSFAVRPVALPAKVVPGTTYPISVEWHELPSYQPGDPTPLGRAALWDSLEATKQHYTVTLALRSAGQMVANATFLTRNDSGTNTFSITAPANATGPFTWSVSLDTAPNVLSHDVEESFEGRDRGAVWPGNTNVVLADPSFIAPWIGVYPFGDPDRDLWQNQGVHLREASHGSQSVFVVAKSPPNQSYSGFSMSYVFPSDWALPTDTKQWSNFVFSYDLKEDHSYNCVLEMQIKNFDPQTTGKWIQFSKPYVPGTNGWDSIRATLDQFVRPPNTSGKFEPDKVHEIVLNVLMLTANVQFVASIDNIQFDGPDQVLPGGETVSFYTSANDVLRINGVRGPSGDIILSWPANAVLQSAADVGGPWSDVPRAISPRTVTPSETKRFFRLRQ